MAPLDELRDLFLHLARINGVSLAERAVADEAKALLTRAGVTVEEDDAASLVGGDTGNLLCFPSAFRCDQPAIVLAAHLDTVAPTARLKPVVDATSIRSDGTTILGGDDRLGMAVLVRLLMDVSSGIASHNNFFVVFTVGEETGLYGAGTIDLTPYHASCAYLFDCSKRPGVYIRESVGLHTFVAQFIGKSAHAGVSPEEGVSAIQLASRAILDLELGRIDPSTTANVGTIHGGEAINAIPEIVTIEGEVRSFAEERIRERIRTMEGTMRASVGRGGKVTFESKSSFAPYVLPVDAPMIRHLETAMRSIGLSPHPIRYTGGSDANQYNARGFPAVNLGIGAQKPHSHEEFVLIEDLGKTYALAHALVRENDGEDPAGAHRGSHTSHVMEE